MSGRTGQTFDHSSRQDLIATSTLLPIGCAEPVPGTHELWQAIEAASERADAALGFELILSLPMLSEFPIDASVAMARDFVRTMIVDKHLLAATLAIHGPHGELHLSAKHDEALGGPDDSFAQAIAVAGANLHAHVLVSPRQVTQAGLAKRRYTTLDPINRGGKVYGRNWGRLWHHFQNRYFASTGSRLRVTPNPPVALTRVPLRAVRRWRKRQRVANQQADGRTLLVNAERERENRDIVETIDGAMRCFDAPFTRHELYSFYRRHLPASVAAELTEATIGLGECAELATPKSTEIWYAGVHQIQHELGAFGRALVLSERTNARRVAATVSEGFADLTRDVLIDLFDGPDLVIIRTWGAADLLTADIARIGEAASLVPVTIATAAGHPIPASVVRDIASMRTRMISDGVIIIDDVDALTPEEVSLVLTVGIAGNNKTVLIQRRDTDWPSLELIDLLRHHVPVLHWSGSPAHADRMKPALSPMPTRSAITLPVAGGPCEQQPPSWPCFGIDLEGEVVTSPPEIARTVKLLTTAPDNLMWSLLGPRDDIDQAALSRRLSQWPGVDEAPAPDEPGLDLPGLDQRDFEAAIAALDPDAGYSHQFVDDDIDPDWPPPEEHDHPEDVADLIDPIVSGDYDLG